MRILIVDDEKISRRIIERILTEILSNDHQYITASSEEEAIGLIYEKQKIDLAIIDLYLPKIQQSDSKSLKSGIDLIGYIKKNAKQQNLSMPPNVIAITQYGENAPEQDAIEFGADDFFEKDTQDKMKERLTNSLKKLGVI